MARPDAARRRAIKNNQAIFQSLTREVQGYLGKKTAVGMAAGALVAAMETTKHDSSRAAANWELNVGGSNPYGKGSGGLNPSEYFDGTYGIGGRNTGGVLEGQVIKFKLASYGVAENGEVAEGGWLYTKAGVGKLGTPAIKLWTPITTIPNYAKNALGDGYSALKTEVEKRARNGAKIAALEAAKEMIGRVRRSGGTYRRNVS